jgi:hypothetical protein
LSKIKIDRPFACEGLVNHALTIPVAISEWVALFAKASERAMTSYGLGSEDVCPVPESVFGLLFRTHPQGLQQVVETIPPYTRAMLALFCYRRAHLQPLSLAIASTCTEEDLVNAGGRLGSVLYEMSQQPDKAPVAQTDSGRRKISLASGKLWNPAPLEDDFED